MHEVIGRELMTFEQYAARVGRRDMIDYAQEGRLAGAIRSEQTVDTARRHLERYVVERNMIRERFTDIFYCNYIFHILF